MIENCLKRTFVREEQEGKTYCEFVVSTRSIAKKLRLIFRTTEDILSGKIISKKFSKSSWRRQLKLRFKTEDKNIINIEARNTDIFCPSGTPLPPYQTSTLLPVTTNSNKPTLIATSYYNFQICRGGLRNLNAPDDYIVWIEEIYFRVTPEGLCEAPRFTFNLSLIRF